MFDGPEIDISSLYFMYIPYSCEFLLIKPKEETTFEIVELYNPQAFATEKYTKFFGTWSENGGIKTPISDFYERRFDLNQTELGVVSKFYVRVNYFGLQFFS